MFLKVILKEVLAFRIVDENLKIFVNNVMLLKKIESQSNALWKILQQLNVNQIFLLNNFNDCITQNQITSYNEFIGDYKKEDGTQIQGINGTINEFNQKNQTKFQKLNTLHKMILSTVSTSSFVDIAIESDEELVEAVDAFLKEFSTTNTAFEIAENDKVFIKYSELENLSKDLLGNWQTINYKLFNQYDLEKKAKNHTDTYKKKREKVLDNRLHSVTILDELLHDEEYKEQKYKGYNDIEFRFTPLNLNDYLIKRYTFLQEQYNFSLTHYNQNSATNVKDKKFSIKRTLDSLKNIERFLNMFQVVNANTQTDINFYDNLKNILEKHLNRDFDKLYNKVRNYLTKKDFSAEKFKLTFDNPNLAGGWATTQEITKSSFILKRYNEKRNSDDIFLAIWNKKAGGKTKLREKLSTTNLNNSYQRMDLYCWSNASRYLPHVFVLTKKYKGALSKEFIEKYDKGYHRLGDNFDKAFMTEYIGHLVKCLDEYENKEYSYKEFNYQFKQPEMYNNIDEFYRDAERQSYKMNFNNICSDTLHKYVNEGFLYLFQIYSKDFSTNKKEENFSSAKDLNTIYFESIFSKENVENQVFQINGGAELFYREKSIEGKVTHKANVPFDKKRKQAEDNKKSLFPYDLTKDKRYSKDKFFFNCPIKINFASQNVLGGGFNKKVNQKLSDVQYIIGLDRGERHLVYATVIDKKGNIIESKSLNIIESKYSDETYSTDYQQKLVEKANKRKQDRQNWDAVEGIKNLKDGYISHVVNVIRQLQQKYNAVIMLEELNRGFKNNRIHIENNVYQKFETALIKKFNYLIDKKDTSTYLKGQQLTLPITTLDKVYKQSGIVYFVPAWNTSKIDPTTGFVNLFYANSGIRYKNIEEAKKFVEKLDDIYFNATKNRFEFVIDYTKFFNESICSKNKWTLNTYGTRINSYLDKSSGYRVCDEIDLTDEFKKLFGKDYSSVSKDGILQKDSKEFFERFLKLFQLMCQLRNSKSGTEIDYMISPVEGVNGINFDSRSKREGLPQNADENGAYNIARKGLMLINQLYDQIENHSGNEKIKFNYIITNKEYLKHLQS